MERIGKSTTFFSHPRPDSAAPSGDWIAIRTHGTASDRIDGHRRTRTDIDGQTDLETQTFFLSDSESLPSPLASSDSLPSLTNGISELKLGPKKQPRKGQFGYKDTSLTRSSPSTSSTLSDVPGDFYWDQLPGHYDTPPTSPSSHFIHPTPTSDSSDDDMPSEFFYGDNRAEDLVPGDYLKSTMNKFKEASSDNFKCDRLANGFATGSKAEKWYNALQPETQSDWKLLKAAFVLKWPPEVVPEVSTEQHRSRLRAEKLKREDIGRVVYVRGLETTGHAAWASRVLALSASADDASGAMIHGIRDAMPAIMKKMVTGTFTSYKAFCDAVKAVDDDAIAMAMAEEDRITQVENETRRLRDEIAQARRMVPAPNSPTAPLRTAFGGFAVSRGGAPRVQAPAPAAAANANANPFAAGVMRGGNIMRGFQRSAGQQQFRSNHLRMADLTANTTGMVQHADNPTGLAAYQQQVQAWITANPAKYSGGDEYAPYPLTPGTDAVGSGECFDCGVHHPRASPHPRAIVDYRETYYRRVANRIIRDDRLATGVANAVGAPANVNLVHVEATEEYGKWRRARGLVENHRVRKAEVDQAVVAPEAAVAGFRGEEEPHTNLVFTDDMYSEHGAMNFVDVYGVGEGRESEEAAKPFIQTVQLVGESGELVDVVATFDDCAMVNCIDTKVFEGARATLSSPDVSPRVLRMANGVLVPSGGCWRGKISVGGVSATGKWEIFSGGGAWQMLLGKPMLKAFGASHEYMDDTVTLNTVAGKVTLRNELDPSAEGSRQKEVAVAHVSDPGECLGTSPLKPGQVNDFILHIPVDQVLGSQESVATVELQTEAGTLGSVEDGSRNPKVAVAHASDPGACDACLPPPSGQVPSPDIPVSVDAEPLQRPSYSARKRARLAARKKRETERALARETVLVVWAAMEKCFVNHGTSSFRRLVRRVKSKAERTRRVLLRRWYNTPWDTATVPAVVVESGDTGGEDEILVGVPSKTSDGKVLVQEVEDSGDIPDVEGLRKQSRDAHASNPGECCGASPLRRKGVDCFHSAACAHRLTEEADWWLSVAELEGDENAGADGLQKQSRNVSASDLGERESISPLRPGSRGQTTLRTEPLPVLRVYEK
ncbi:hypothetical protein DFH08DRAFT_819204 [Mycena albidolilacea]|uniref:Uncharacterized protein n=1 Tax=Mycena albidolilacea TaxID=1033008 RepID=A0AAD6ZEG4_9AGAR|nr:hypothetical protein DFH08DRAFT_819204 [Mycena albidolilacea]